MGGICWGGGGTEGGGHLERVGGVGVWGCFGGGVWVALRGGDVGI